MGEERLRIQNLLYMIIGLSMLTQVKLTITLTTYFRVCTYLNMSMWREEVNIIPQKPLALFFETKSFIGT